MEAWQVITFISVLPFGVLPFGLLGIGLQAFGDIDACSIKFRIFHSCNSDEFQEICVENGMELFSSPFYDSKRSDTILLGIPFLGSHSNFNVKPMIDVLASRCEFNIILLDNTASTDVTVFEYASSAINSYQDSLRFAEVLNSGIAHGLLSPERITAIGYSLGAQIVGHVCRNIGSRCNQIYGLDPAGPLYMPPNPFSQNLLPEFQTVSKDDACRVTFLICNSGGLGTLLRPANEHIIINGGMLQPNCAGSISTIHCSHDLCNNLMMEAIVNPGACLARSKACLNNPRRCYRHGIRNITIPADDTCSSKDWHDAEHFYLTTSSDGHCMGLKGAGRMRGLGGIVNERVERIGGMFSQFV